MIQKIIFNFFIYNIALSSIAIAQHDSTWSVNELSNITVYLAQINTNNIVGGTGTIISHNQKFYLLTASHVANQLNNEPKIVFRVDGDKPATLDLKSITNKNQLNWINHPEADISILQILSTDKNVIKRLEDWSFSSKYIYKEKAVISRDNDLTFLGFPILDMEMKYFSPLSFVAFPASGLITNKRYDIDSKCTFFYLDQPSMQGCSGSGVYCSVKKGGVYMSLGKTLMLGVVHGTAKDDTGGKLAAICPSFYIWDLLNQAEK